MNLAKHVLMQTYNTDVDTMVFIRKLWSLSLFTRDDIICTYLKILEDVPQWEEDHEEDHGAGEMLNDGMRKYTAYFERTFQQPKFWRPFL